MAEDVLHEIRDVEVAFHRQKIATGLTGPAGAGVELALLLGRGNVVAVNEVVEQGAVGRLSGCRGRLR